MGPALAVSYLRISVPSISYWPGSANAFRLSCATRAVKDKFYADFANAIRVIEPSEIFVEFLDTEDRVIIEATPTKSITCDGDKMAAATARFLESRQ